LTIIFSFVRELINETVFLSSKRLCETILSSRRNGQNHFGDDQRSAKAQASLAHGDSGVRESLAMFERALRGNSWRSKPDAIAFRSKHRGI
jgi:hypothetical protein